MTDAEREHELGVVPRDFQTQQVQMMVRDCGHY